MMPPTPMENEFSEKSKKILLKLIHFIFLVWKNLDPTKRSTPSAEYKTASKVRICYLKDQ